MTEQSPDAFVAHAAEATLAQPTFHFTIRNERGKTSPFPGVQLQGVEGSVKQPDRFQAVASAKALFLNVEIQVVGIEGRLWMSNPIQGAKHLHERRVDDRYLPLTRPDNVVHLLLKLLDTPRIDRTENDQKCGALTVVAGSFNLTRLKEVAPDLVAGPILTNKALPVEIWIDSDAIIRRFKIHGPMVSYDEANVVRVVEFSRYGEPVSIPTPE